jgi:hypothetical protein
MVRRLKNLLRFMQLFSPTGCAIHGLQAAEAFEVPPLNKVARRYAMIALCFLLACAAFLLAAALIDTLAKMRPLSEKVGFAGILCLILCVHSGLCYKDANSQERGIQPKRHNGRTLPKLQTVEGTRGGRSAIGMNSVLRKAVRRRVFEGA